MDDFTIILLISSIVFFVCALTRKSGSAPQIACYLGAILTMGLAIPLSLSLSYPSTYLVSNIVISGSQSYTIPGYNLTIALNANPQPSTQSVPVFGYTILAIQGFEYIYLAVCFILMLAGVLARAPE